MAVITGVPRMTGSGGNPEEQSPHPVITGADDEGNTARPLVPRRQSPPPVARATGDEDDGGIDNASCFLVECEGFEMKLHSNYKV